MTAYQSDQRSAGRRALDEQIAAELPLDPPELPADAQPASLETHLAKLRPRPMAIAGIVENGLVRPIDPDVRLAEHTRVIIVAAEP